MFRPLVISIVLLSCGLSSTAMADPGPLRTGAEIEHSATQLSRVLMGRLDQARRLGDEGSATCLDVTLSETHILIGRARNRGMRLEAAERVMQQREVTHHRAVLRSLAERVRQLWRRADTCVNGTTSPDGVTIVTVIRDPRTPRSDPTVVTTYRMANERRRN